MFQSESECLWLDFEKAFKESILSLHAEGPLHEFLWNKTNMTSFYKEKLFQKISDTLKLNLSEKEYLRVDMTMYKLGDNSYHVPYIVIESENDPDGDLGNEIKKLLHLNAPLKVLITRGSFEEDILNNDTDWKYVIDDFVQHKRMIGYFAFISADWQDNKLKYQYIVYKDNGQSYCNLQTLLLEA
jgi:hypothetical protein